MLIYMTHTKKCDACLREMERARKAARGGSWGHSEAAKERDSNPTKAGDNGLG